MEAARKGHKEVIKVFLRFGADILLTSHEVMSYGHWNGMIEFICTGRYKRIIDFCCSYRCSAHYCLVQDYSGMPTTLREAVTYGSTDVTSFITQHCNKASEKVRSTLTKQAYLRIWIVCAFFMNGAILTILVYVILKAITIVASAVALVANTRSYLPSVKVCNVCVE